MARKPKKQPEKKEKVDASNVVGLRAEALHMGSVGKQAALLVKAQNPRARLL